MASDKQSICVINKLVQPSARINLKEPKTLTLKELAKIIVEKLELEDDDDYVLYNGFKTDKDTEIDLEKQGDSTVEDLKKGSKLGTLYIAINSKNPKYGGRTTSAYGSNYYQRSGTTSYQSRYRKVSRATGFVGLSNQGATCYLNSLLQTLYMTPEFRNALYEWDFQEYSERIFQQKLAARNAATETETGGDEEESAENEPAVAEDVSIDEETSDEHSGELDEKSGGEETEKVRRKLSPEEMFQKWRVKFGSSSIPRQLQKLFLKLQLSETYSCTTTDLTTSFGWDKAEAFTQHDVQELCRVLFDALETTWANTERENLINELYQGQMKDYVRCLECGYEGSRTDSYLDIPLVIKPFGSTKVMGSIEEALKKFVEVEKLEGDNQYSCSECEIKVDAHKGLSFTSFPYLLTLQLKRFDFDYMTMRRVKLNDRVTFPEILDMNQFLEGGEKVKVAGETSEEVSSEISSSEDEVETSKEDDESSSEEESEEEDNTERARENKAKIESALLNGPYVYELFSILIHRGSAVGGHYYAYIKSFSKDKWMCFNDSSVTTISSREIESTYGSAPKKIYSRYTGKTIRSDGSSGANAYMLMYRQVDPTRNIDEPSKDSIPEHVKQMIDAENALQKEKDKEATEKRQMVTVKAYYKGNFKSVQLHRKNTSIGEAVKAIAEEWAFEDVPLECIRIREYQTYYETAGKPYSDPDVMLSKVNFYGTKSVLVEIRSPDEDFPEYDPNSFTLKVFVHNRETDEWSSIQDTSIKNSSKFQDLQLLFEEKFGIPVENQVICKGDYNTYGAKVLKGATKSIKYDLRINQGCKLWLEYHEKGDSAFNLKYARASPYRRTTTKVNDENVEFPLAFTHISEMKDKITVKFGDADSQELCYSATVSKKNSLLDLKNIISEQIDLPLDEFKVMKGSVHYKVELRDENKSLGDFHIMNATRLYIEKGSPLRSGELPLKVVAFDPTKEEKQTLSLFSTALPGTMSVEEAKIAIYKQFLVEKENEANRESADEDEERVLADYDMPTPENMRLRDLFSSAPSKEFSDDETIKNVCRGRTYTTPKIAVQPILNPDARRSKRGDYLVFLQQFIPSEFKLGPITEIVTSDSESLSSLRSRITEMTNVENLALTSYRFGGIRLLSLPKTQWLEPEESEEGDDNEGSEEESSSEEDRRSYYKRYSKTVSKLRLRGGYIIVFKDNEEELKELTMEERNALAAKEKQSKHKGRSYRREEGVKINTNQQIEIEDYEDSE
eukprot:TRINITY_DN1062_c0_g1_i1.p1 TRINITY_DN1062_c0_g1~~TRINITY_DN1062_c0_g1_i1.p1  ORF type:complete len:1244 (+),score=371.90 TRINITY_DN1062_c0_g1_i1:66-3797(+)